VSKSSAFSEDYATARNRFREAAAGLGWRLEAHPVGARGPGGEELTVDAAYSTLADPEKVLVLSSGLHGLEEFFGSALQTALLEEWASSSPPEVKCLFLHGLNPFGFAWLRRCNEDNIDLNRNFLLDGDSYKGAPAAYPGLDELLNPRQPPSRSEPFKLKAMWTIARRGMPAFRQAVAAGQYDFPKRLFFGGAAPSRTFQLMNEKLGSWLQGGRHVVHIDLHTGLGPKGVCKLLIDYPLSEDQRTRLAEWYVADSFESCDSSDFAYVVLFADLNCLVEFHDLPAVLVAGGSKPMGTTGGKLDIVFNCARIRAAFGVQGSGKLC